jgi:putative transcriptional regulator
MQKPTKDNLGDLLVQSLTELHDGLSGRSGKLTVRTVEIPEPNSYSAEDLHALRNKLQLSQALFARLLGVSKKLVEAWEVGTRKPSPMACRLLDAVSRNPTSFIKHTRKARRAA